MLLEMTTPHELAALDPSNFPHGFTHKEFEHMLRIFKAFWIHSGNPKDPHAELTSGKHSTGFINLRIPLSYTNLSRIMAQTLVRVLRRRNLLSTAFEPTWVVGSDTAATGLSKDVANILGVRWYPVNKRDDKTQEWGPIDIGPTEIVLHVEELRTTTKTAFAVRKGIRERHPYPIRFHPWLPVLVDRPDDTNDVVENSSVLPVFRYNIENYSGNDCPLCRQGSKALRPAKNWAELVGA